MIFGLKTHAAQHRIAMLTRQADYADDAAAVIGHDQSVFRVDAAAVVPLAIHRFDRR